MISNWKIKYRQQKSRAGERGISFLLTFNEWFKIWEDSGHLQDRGKYRGQYCMARFKDRGPYKLGNVKIVPVEKNSSEATKGTCLSKEHKLKISSAMTGIIRKRRTKELIRKSMIGKYPGIKNPAAKLTEYLVTKIRSEIKQHSARALSAKYNVCIATVRNIVNRRNWKHLP